MNIKPRSVRARVMLRVVFLSIRPINSFVKMFNSHVRSEQAWELVDWYVTSSRKTSLRISIKQALFFKNIFSDSDRHYFPKHRLCSDGGNIQIRHFLTFFRQLLSHKIKQLSSFHKTNIFHCPYF